MIMINSNCSFKFRIIPENEKPAAVATGIMQTDYGSAGLHTLRIRSVVRQTTKQ
jgi:hypothetical protein